MRLHDIMSDKVESVGFNDPAEFAWEKMRAARIRHLVVMKDNEVIGIVSERDLGGKLGASLRRNRKISRFVSEKVVSATADMTPRRAANLMRGNSIGCLPVLNSKRDRKLVGIITISDLLELIGRGVEKPVERSKRWTLRHRGLRPRSI